MKIIITSFLFLTIFCAAAWMETGIELVYPEYFPSPSYTFKENPLEKNVIELGRALFYDPILSKNNQISCASCHSPYSAFAHTDHDLSHGIDNKIGSRNAPGLFNLAWQSSFMWDGAINHLDMQALAPITSPTEMGEDFKHVIDELNNKSIYKELFFTAFKDSLVTGERFLKALSQFQLTLVSANSKYDKVKSKEEIFTEQEENGYSLFKKNCDACHAEPLFSTFEFKNNGLSVDTTLNDFGKMNISKNAKDSLLFKIPTLRNLSYTFPYMHDGRFRKLREVINHYTDNENRDPTVSKELAKGINLSEREKVDLLSFLLTLNDPSFIQNPSNKFPKEILFEK